MMGPLIVNPFHATGPFLYPLKTSENSGFLMFSGVIEIDQWHKIGKYVKCELTFQIVLTDTFASKLECSKCFLI